ncbi:MAG: hypothetical protein IPG66_08690 [Hydrogenophilales bacterium]|nr:hypothetical protein [Hydrogenophilales bacterium]
MKTDSGTDRLTYFILCLNWAISIVAWGMLAVVVYNYGHRLADYFRAFVFDNLCPEDVMHPLLSRDPLTREIVDWVDWCDTFWWHPFRLSTRIVFGAATALTIGLLARAFLPRTIKAITRATVFVSIMAGLHIYWKVFGADMTDMTQHACAWGQKSAELCHQQLGYFGDQRLYYPYVVALTAVYLLRYERRRIRRRQDAESS